MGRWFTTSARDHGRSRLATILVVLASGLVLVGSAGAWWKLRPRSTLGAYRGFSAARFDGWLRESRYVAVRDGTRLAVDLFQPTRDGQRAEARLPVVWSHHRYGRARRRPDGVQTMLDERPWLRELLAHGYVVAAVDVRGAGASFGVMAGPFSVQEAQDAYDLTEWFAAQPWCSGRVGMYGSSYAGITQYLAAGLAPPHLKAIFPEMAMFDLYGFAHAGGIYREDFSNEWSRLTRAMDRDPSVAAVDQDHDGALLQAALKEHHLNRYPDELFSQHPTRDSVDASTSRPLYGAYDPARAAEGIRTSSVAVYHLAGWLDLFPRDALLWYANLKQGATQRITIGPWSHSRRRGFDLAAEHLRWYDYWLRDIQNGVDREPPISYYRMGKKQLSGWQYAQSWPPSEQRERTLFLGPASRIEPGRAAPQIAQIAQIGLGDLAVEGSDRFVVDYTASSGKPSRWSDGYGAFGLPDLESLRGKGLVYETAPLPEDLEVTGHPTVHLWVAASAPDANVFLYLEDLPEEGRGQYVTEGALRASHRSLREAPYNNMGLPFHRGSAPDVEPLVPSQPSELVVDLHPVSYVFARGHRIRLWVTGADRDNAATPEWRPPPALTVLRGEAHPSRLTLPVMPLPPSAAVIPTAAALVLPVLAGLVVVFVNRRQRSSAARPTRSPG